MKLEDLISEFSAKPYKHPLIENEVTSNTTKPLAKRDKGRFFIVLDPTYPYNGGYRIAQWSGKRFWNEDGGFVYPTHWQKIPKRMNIFLPDLRRPQG